MGTCKKCSYGFYLISAPDRVVSCKQCPQNARCFGENRITARLGNYRTSLDSNETLACLNPAACLAGDADNLRGACAVGYKGMMCGSCQPDHLNETTGQRFTYIKSDWLTCSECPEK